MMITRVVLFLFFITASAAINAATYYVDQTAGNDANNGSLASPWQNCPGMNTYGGGGSLVAGDTVYFDRDDTWTVTGTPQGLLLVGGVSYIGDTWEADSGNTGTRATIIAGNDFNDTGVIRFRDHASIETVFQGFEVDVNGMSANGVDINHGFWSLMTGAMKRVENVIVHDVFTEQALGEYKYGIAMSNWGGASGTLENVEIIDCVVYNIGRDAIVLYPSDDPASSIGNITIRGCEVYNTGQDPNYLEGHGIVAKGWVYNSIIENNYVHDVNSSAIFISGPEGATAQRGASNLHVRNNILTTADDNGIIRLYKTGDKDLKIYGNIILNNSSSNGALSLNGNAGGLDLLVYNNTFYNTFINLGPHTSTVNTFDFINNIVQYNGTQLSDGGAIINQSNNLLVSSDPGFVNSANLPTGFSGTYGVDIEPNTDGLNLTAGSSAIDGGAALTATYNGSINSVTRPSGSAWDIGAYEYVASGGAVTTTVTLKWDAIAETEIDNYVIGYGTTSGSYPQTVTCSTTPTECDVTGLTSGTLYYFAVRADDSTGDGVDSGWSNEVYLTPIAAAERASAAFTPDVTSGTAPLTVTFTSNATGSINGWYWSFGDGTAGQGETIQHTFTNTGTYTVWHVVTGSKGADADSTTITVN